MSTTQQPMCYFLTVGSVVMLDTYGQKKSDSPFTPLIETWKQINIQPGNLHVNEPEVIYKTRQIISPFCDAKLLSEKNPEDISNYLNRLNNFPFAIGRNRQNG